MLAYKKLFALTWLLNITIINGSEVNFYCPIQTKIFEQRKPVTSLCSGEFKIRGVNLAPCKKIDGDIIKWTPNINEDKNSLISTRIDLLKSIMIEVDKLKLEKEDYATLAKAISNSIIKINPMIILNGKLNDFCKYIIDPLIELEQNPKITIILNDMKTYLQKNETQILYIKALYDYIDCNDEEINKIIPYENFNKSLKTPSAGFKHTFDSNQSIKLKISPRHIFKPVINAKTIIGFHHDYMKMLENNKIITKIEGGVCFKKNEKEYCASPKSLFDSNLTQNRILDFLTNAFSDNNNIKKVRQVLGRNIYVLETELENIENDASRTKVDILITPGKNNTITLATAYPSCATCLKSEILDNSTPLDTGSSNSPAAAQ